MKKTYYYIGINNELKVLRTIANNKKYMNKKIDWERFSKKSDANKKIEELRSKGYKILPVLNFIE